MNERLRRVLVVDDDADIRLNITDILNDLGYETAMAGDGEAALQCVRACRFEVVVLDYKMPGMDGVTLCREIKKLQPSIATIMVTAYAGSDGAKRALDAGARNVLRKPVDLDDLLKMIAVNTG